MSIYDINKKKEKIIQSTKSISRSNITNNFFSSQNSKIIKIKTISKQSSIKNRQDIPKNLNKVNNSSKINTNNKSNNAHTNEDNDDFDFILKESIKAKESINNIKLQPKQKNKLIFQKQININLKNINKNNIYKIDALINQHTESIQLNYYSDKLNEKNRTVVRKKLNFNLNTKQNVINIVKIAPIINLDFTNQEMKNQFINNNIANFNMLNKINFFDRLKSISDKRYTEFTQEFKRDYFFLDINEFENIFINEKDININSPLTLIFHYCFNPEIKQVDSGENFFEFIYKKRGDTNYSMEYNKDEIRDIPKYFNNINYVNYLFNNFKEKDLNIFLDEIDTWKKTFSFEQKFKYTKHVIKTMTLRDVATIYFISPLDMVIDYHSYGSDFPMADFFVAISQYRFHCDINFNKNKGKFNFKTSCTVYNTIKLVKQTLLKKYVIYESNVTNQEEIQTNIWPNLKKIIKKEDEDNQNISSEIFETYLKNNLNKYSKIKPDEKIYCDFFQKTADNDAIKSSFINIDSGANVDIISNYNNEFNLFNIINNIKIKEIEDNDEANYIFKNINNKENNKEKQGIIKHKGIKEKEEKKSKKKKLKQRLILKYGVCIIFILYVIKTLVSLNEGYITKEKIFNIFLIIVIGLILATIQFRKT